MSEPRGLPAGALEPLVPRAGTRLTDAVYHALQSALSQGRVPTGARLVEQEVAAALAVSRTPVREALHRLEADGLIESTPRRGFVVVDILQDAAVVYGMRQRMEGLAASLAAHRISVEELEALDAVQTRMEELADEASPTALRELAELNRAFHTGVSEAAGSPRLLRLIHHLAPAYLSHQAVAMYPPDERRRSYEGHRRILESLWARDADACERLVREHLEHGKRMVLAGLAQPPPR